MWKRETMGPDSALNSRPELIRDSIKDWEVGPSPKKVSVLGSAIQLEGVIRGEDDILLHGKIKGRIELPKNSVTIGVEGFLEGDIFAQVVVLEGAVKGNIRATERVILHSSAQLIGNISCDRMTIEEGAKINGTIDMAPNVKESRREESITANEELIDNEEAISH